MISLFRKLIDALLWDELAARRWLRGLGLWVAAAVMQVSIAGTAAVEAWTVEDWVKKLAISALFAAPGMITAGEKNPKPPEATPIPQPPSTPPSP